MNSSTNPGKVAKQAHRSTTKDPKTMPPPTAGQASGALKGPMMMSKAKAAPKSQILKDLPAHSTEQDAMIEQYLSTPSETEYPSSTQPFPPSDVPESYLAGWYDLDFDNIQVKVLEDARRTMAKILASNDWIRKNNLSTTMEETNSIKTLVIDMMTYIGRQPVVTQFNSKANERKRFPLVCLASLDRLKHEGADLSGITYNSTACWF